MKDIEAQKLDLLSKELKKRKDKAVSSAKLAAIVYGLLVIFVFGYTWVIFGKLQASVTPDSISAVVNNTLVSAIPTIREKMIVYSKQQGPVLADKAVQAAHEAIPQVEDIIKRVIDRQVEILLTEMKTEMFPQFVDILRKNADEINQHAEVLTDDVAVQELAKIIAEELQNEINYHINAFKTVHELRAQLDELAAKPAAKLTRKEAAEREILVNWLYLVKNGESFQSVLTLLVQRFSYALEHFAGGSAFLELSTE